MIGYYSNGTYSFFPCKPSFKAPVEKFALNADIGDNSISTSLRNVKYVAENSEQAVVKYWNNLKEKCFSEGYSLGVKAELPQSVQSLDADNLLKLVNNVNNKIDKLVYN